MKTRKLLLLLALAAATTGMQAQRIKGSDTVLPIAQQTAERFMTLTPSARVTVTGGGTGVGISALLDQTTDIAMASRAIKFSEKMKAKAAGDYLKPFCLLKFSRFCSQFPTPPSSISAL